jgi:muskelin
LLHAEVRDRSNSEGNLRVRPSSSFLYTGVKLTFGLISSCGLTRSQEHGSQTNLQPGCPHWVYQYHTRPGKWSQLTLQKADPADPPSVEPVSRYAHQVAYDPNSKTLYLHGGVAGLQGPLETEGRDGAVIEEIDEKEQRLDDFWAMKLTR